MSGHTYTHTHTYIHTYTHDNYYNPRCACAPRVNKHGGITTAHNHIHNIDLAVHDTYLKTIFLTKVIDLHF